MISMKVIGTPLYQWETGRQMQIFPILGMNVNAVHFSNLGDSEALVVEPKEENGMIVADIPNVLLQSGRKLVAYSVNVSQDCCETILESFFSICPRPRPSDYVYTETEVKTYDALVERMDEIEKKGVQSVNGAKPDESGNVQITIPNPDVPVTDEQIAQAVEDYLIEHPIEVPDSGGNVDVSIDGETLVIAEKSTATIDGETLIL